MSEASELVRPLTSDSEEEALFRQMVRQFAEKTVAPHIKEMDREQRMNPELIKQAFELGLMGIEVPAEFGGSGASFTTAVIAVEELAAVDPSMAIYVDVQNTLVNNAVLRWGNDEQKKRYLPRLASDLPASYCLSESGSGSDAFALSTKAVEDGDVFRLNGEKMWITSGAEAGFFLLFATVDPSLGYKGITAFLVERDFPGFTVGRTPGLA